MGATGSAIRIQRSLAQGVTFDNSIVYILRGNMGAGKSSLTGDTDGTGTTEVVPR